MGEEFHLVVVHKVKHSLDTLKVVGLDSRRETVIVVKRDYCRVEEGEGLRGRGTVVLADSALEVCP